MKLQRFLILLITLLFQTSFHSKAQSCFDEIKDELIYSLPLQAFNPEDVLSFRNKLMCFVGNELDTTDIELFTEHPLFSELYTWFNTDRSTPATYNDLYLFFIETKSKTSGYNEIRELHIEKLMVYALPAIYSNWGIAREYFLKLEHTNDQAIEPTRVFFKANQNSTKTIYDVITAHQEYQMRIYHEEENNVQKQFDEIFATSKPINMDSLIRTSKTEGKPILLYFTGYNVINARKLEEYILKDLNILERLKSDFIFCPLYIDDRKSLKESDWVFFEEINKTAKTVGEVNFHYQMETFQITKQPYFVALNKKDEINSLGEYDNFKTSSDFIEFLDKILFSFEN